MNKLENTPKESLRDPTGQAIKNLIKNLIRKKIKTPEALAVAKRRMAKDYKIPCPTNIALLKTYHELLKKKGLKKSALLESLLQTRPIRSLSGIVNISVLTKSYPCPGRCLYCPAESGIPKSYVSGEPAVERAKSLGFDPYLQTQKRIEMLEVEGHPTDKIELRIVGGTWSYYPKTYQDWFVKRCFEACNEKESKNLNKAQKLNEKAKRRIVGLSIETRPDFITSGASNKALAKGKVLINEIRKLRNFGVTMVELGVQSIYDDVLKKNLRGHGVKETISATKLLKDAGFKVLYQMMPNLFGSSLKKDEKMFEELFESPDFQPDLLKIYPCALLREAPLYKWWKKKKYKPYTKIQLIGLIKKIKKNIPYYVRIQRISRDIPSQLVIAGPAKISNLRQVISEKMKKEGWQCNCIRCREVREKYNPREKLYLFRQDYKASGGKEIFLSFENKRRDKLYSLLRLRITSDNKMIIREIHTYGQQIPISGEQFSANSPQHKGLGKKLIKKAEEIVKRESASRRISVIAGVGARDYFRKLGYRLENTYMVKNV
ncbi:MAG: tRNA uridine(34) 5-carboxymethylaminomethyl modification radical SAM/GNAT enzyme Elp3 [Candidatus Tagabacteria bacterium CG09_land_8_20_14_0_10_41_14]|uniref:tRNA carboxymethyluridine synthase n=1 Tax=Candidatus Tagabacteria bacterium CG09_land_8_20_14_0_10_41_14 TaxID=1975021 RepID=A0A2H0WM50_9BACT|nr:MAG: tRNA uridine(34) 5-carboxymethylaminomethyl modification radical SAM/GNAT enzyme Elp3 [Candidatus Tagabacteria bacterium CG09_land_8_20_14_0_10_41_14]